MKCFFMPYVLRSKREFPVLTIHALFDMIQGQGVCAMKKSYRYLFILGIPLIAVALLMANQAFKGDEVTASTDGHIVAGEVKDMFIDNTLSIPYQSIYYQGYDESYAGIYINDSNVATLLVTDLYAPLVKKVRKAYTEEQLIIEKVQFSSNQLHKAKIALETGSTGSLSLSGKTYNGLGIGINDQTNRIEISTDIPYDDSSWKDIIDELNQNGPIVMYEYDANFQITLESAL